MPDPHPYTAAGRIVTILLLALAALEKTHAGNCEMIEKQNYPESWTVPQTAVDTDTLPDIRLDPDAPDERPLPVFRLAENTWFLFGNIATLNEENRGFNANAGFIVTGEGVIVIDTLGTPKLGKRLISTIRCVTGQPIRYLVVTHNHPDHAYGGAAFMALEKIEIIAHEGTVDYNHSTTIDSSVEYRRDLIPEDMKGFKPLKADRYIDKDPFSKTRIRLGDVTLDIYNTGKHHSYGDLVVHQVEQDIVWISDLAFNQRTTYMGDGDSEQVLESQDWLLENFGDAKLMVPGHGSAQTPPFPMVSKTHDYVTRMRDAMQEAVEKGVPMMDAVDGADFENWEDVPLYEMNQRANANFVYREMEKAYFENF